MGYTVDYRADVDANWNAVSDCKNWLGHERFDEFVRACRYDLPDGTTYHHWTRIMFMSGIQGFPLIALQRYIWPCPIDSVDNPQPPTWESETPRWPGFSQ